MKFTRTTHGISLRLLKSKENLEGTFRLKPLKVRQHCKFKIKGFQKAKNC